MKEIMAETKPEAVEVGHEEWVARAVLENARNMARCSIGATPSPDFPQEAATDLEVADYLSRVEVDDNKLSEQVRQALDKNISNPDTIFQAGSLAIAKAQAAKEVASSPQKTRLERLSQKIAGQTSKLLDSSASRRAFLKAAPGLLAVLATSCGAVDTVRDIPWTVEYRYPTPEATEVAQPTEVPTPTEEPWSIESLTWHFLGEWQRVETTNEETGETLGYNVRFAVSEGLPFDRIDFATAESTYLIFEDGFSSAGVNEGQLRADLETLLTENPDGWAEEDMARAISLALEGAQGQFANINSADRQRWQEFIEAVRTRGVVFIFHNEQVLGNTQDLRLRRPSRVNYPSEEILPADGLLGYMEPIGTMYENAPRITRRWAGFLPDGTPCFYISARKAWRDFYSNDVPEAEDLSMGAFLTNEVLVTLRHFNPAFVGDPPRFLVDEPGSAVSVNSEVSYQDLLYRTGGFTAITGLTVPPGSLDPEVNSSP